MKKLNISVLMGFVSCFGMIIFGITSNGGIRTILNFVHIPSMIITFGGSFCAVMMTVDSFKDFFIGLFSIKKAFSKQQTNIDEIGENIFALSTFARKEGLLSLEEQLSNCDNEFLKKGIRLMIDGTNPELIKDIMETELMNHIEINNKQIQFWENLGAYGPAWGMIGTLLGLINMMKSMGSDPSSIGSGMSLALITTLYGSLLANWICIPIAAKLKKSNMEEELQMTLIIEGVLSIQAGENPMLIKEKIRAFRSDWEEKQVA